MKAGWGAVLRGDPTDLEDWRHVLGNEFDPRTEVHGEDTILRSANLDLLSTADEVRAKALDMIDYLNGALALWEGTRPIAFGGSARFAEDGSIHRTVFAQVTAIARTKMRATAEVIGKDGKPKLAIPRESEVQLWADIAEDDDLLQEALMYVGKESTWFNIYKAIECLELRFGGGETEFLKLGWASQSQIKLMKRSANTLRHAKQKFEPPEKPMALVDATSLIRALLRKSLLAAAAGRQTKAP